MGAHEEAKRIVDEYTPIIMRIGYTYLGSREDAEDVCQETLFKLVRRIPPFDDREREKAWVIRVTINACKDRLKSAAHQRNVSLEEAEHAVAEHQSDGSVLEAVQVLPEAYREAIFLHYGEGYKIAEIAEIVGKSKDAVAKNLSRGRDMLRNALGVEL